jgi:type IV pilus assembly protein PilA
VAGAGPTGRHAVPGLEAEMTLSRALKTRRGFTLVELMIVIVIVGILATLAVVGYRKMVAQSHSSEAVQVINSIRIAQEAVHAETGSYSNISTTLCAAPDCQSLYPQAFFAHPTNTVASTYLVGNYKVGWGGSGSACSGECASWLSLPVHSPGAVYHGYSTKSGTAGTTPPALSVGCTVTVGGSAGSVGATAITWPPTANAQDWFVVTAIGDVDGDGIASMYVGTSFNNDITPACEGE